MSVCTCKLRTRFCTFSGLLGVDGLRDEYKFLGAKGISRVRTFCRGISLLDQNPSIRIRVVLVSVAFMTDRNNGFVSW